MKNKEDEAREALKKALEGLEEVGTLTEGTNKLVEWTKKCAGCTNAELATIAGVSVVAIDRWKKNNRGKSSVLKNLITFAESLLSGKLDNESYISRDSSAVCAAVKNLKFGEIEGKLTATLEKLLGNSLERCELTKLSSVDGSVKLELLLT